MYVVNCTMGYAGSGPVCSKLGHHQYQRLAISAAVDKSGLHADVHREAMID